MSDLYEKVSKVVTKLQPHQQRVIDKLKASHGVLAFHGLGSGKSLAAIAAADQLGEQADVVTPAPLVANYEKELKKHHDTAPTNMRIRSYERAAKDDDLNTKGLVVFDEAHRGRNADTNAAKLMRQSREAKYRMMLTATPAYNSPADLAPVLNAVAGRNVLPDDPQLFKQTFVGEKTEEAPFFTRVKGRLLGHPVDTESHPTLINRERLIQAARGYVDVHKGGGEGFPDRIDEMHEVGMSPKQKELYTFAEGKMPWYLRAKIRAGLPMSKQENKELNAFQGALRQISNTPRGFTKDVTDANELEHSPKIQQVVNHLLAAKKGDPNHRGVIYSNYLDSGIYPVSRALKAAGIEHNVFDGSVPTAKRAQMVQDYNSGKTPVMLLSGAGSEGLDLKGTKTMQLLEPHWHDQRPAQVIGRGIRYKSHEHLPENERKVRVMRYYSTIPAEADDYLGKLIGQKPKQSIEQYLKHMSDEKTRLNDEIAAALQEASDYGPLQKKAARALGLPDEVMRQVVERLGDSELAQKKREKYIDFSHPAGLHLHSPYNAEFVAKNVHEHFGDDPNAFADQIRDDMLNMGYASLGSISKKNEKQRKMKMVNGAAYGSLATSALLIGDQLRGNKSIQGRIIPKIFEAANKLPGGPLVKVPVAIAGLLAMNAVPQVIGGTIGWNIGKALHRPLGAQDVTAKNVHPLLVPPKAIKAKVKLEVNEK